MYPQRLKCVINEKHNIVPIQTLVLIAFFSFFFIYLFIYLFYYYFFNSIFLLRRALQREMLVYLQ